VDQKKEIVTVALRSKPPVLRSESADEYTSLHKKLIEEIGPQGPIEAVYVEEITALIWDIQRLRNCKVSVIHQMSRRALESILNQLLPINEKIKAQGLANAGSRMRLRRKKFLKSSSDLISTNPPLRRKLSSWRRTNWNGWTKPWSSRARGSINHFASSKAIASVSQMMCVAIPIGC
jgi:hypothetical protein